MFKPIRLNQKQSKADPKNYMQKSVQLCIIFGRAESKNHLKPMSSILPHYSEHPTKNK